MTIYTINESTLAVKVGEALSEQVNEKVHALFRQLKQNPVWVDVIPAYNTVTVVYDPLMLRQSHSSSSLFAARLLQQAIDQSSDDAGLASRFLKIPVCYDPSFGLDLPQIADQKNINQEDVVTLHTELIYRIYMIGFLPGFAYMGKVDARIASPRLTKPRTLVPAGSVGIAGEQTGIYPVESPGGWNIIGRTPVPLFDVGKSNPVFFEPGDRISFFPISRSEFEAFDVAKFFATL